MAKLQEQKLTIKISKLVRDDQVLENPEMLGSSEIESLEAVIRELTEQGVLIEIEKDQE